LGGGAPAGFSSPFLNVGGRLFCFFGSLRGRAPFFFDLSTFFGGGPRHPCGKTTTPPPHLLPNFFFFFFFPPPRPVPHLVCVSPHFPKKTKKQTPPFFFLGPPPPDKKPKKPSGGGGGGVWFQNPTTQKKTTFLFFFGLNRILVKPHQNKIPPWGRVKTTFGGREKMSLPHPPFLGPGGPGLFLLFPPPGGLWVFKFFFPQSLSGGCFFVLECFFFEVFVWGVVFWGPFVPLFWALKNFHTHLFGF